MMHTTSSPRRRRSTLRRLIPAAALAAAFASSLFVTASASVSGDGCVGTGVDTAGLANPTSVTFNDTDVWHVKKDSVLHLTGKAPRIQQSGSAGALLFGAEMPGVSLGGGTNSDNASTDLHVSDLAKFAKVIAVSGKSDDCSGYVVLVVDDVAATSTYAGLVAGALTLLGLAFLIPLVITW